MAAAAKVRKAASHLHTAGAEKQDDRNTVVRQTFPGFATGRSAGDPVSRPKEGMPLKGKQVRDK